MPDGTAVPNIKSKPSNTATPTGNYHVACAPLGWANVLTPGASGTDHSPTKHTPVSAASTDADHVIGEQFAMADIPPWEQFDRDANDYLVNRSSEFWNNVGGPGYDEFPTAGAVPCYAGNSAKSKMINAGERVSGGNAAHSRASGGNAARPANAGDVVPAMPLLIDGLDWTNVFPPGWSDQPPDDPYGFGLEYREQISSFVEGHREKIHSNRRRRCPFNALIVRPVGTKERLGNPKANAAMDKERGQLREKTVWDETVVREWADVAREAIEQKKEVHFGWLFGIC